MRRHVHVVGAGVAGLAAALALSRQGDVAVTVHEATNRAGGRCRSYDDARLGRRIDNGNHLVVSGNRAVAAYLHEIGATSEMEMLAPRFPFVDLADGRRWQVAVPRHPLGLALPGARPPGTRFSELLDARRLIGARRGRTVAEVVRGRGGLWRGFWVPMTVAVMNAPPDRADAGLLAAALAESFLKGAAASRPLVARTGLGDALVAPAVAALRARGVTFRWRRPLRQIAAQADRVTGLQFGRGDALDLHAGDAAVLALPPAALASVLPETRLPADGASIVNAHFRVPSEVAETVPRILGLLSGRVDWVFRRGDVLSTTTSGVDADPFWERPKEAALTHLWAEVARAIGRPDLPLPPARLVTERAATFDQSPEGCARRTGTATRWANLFLAGDHVETGLPATIEGAMRSGNAAAAAALAARAEPPANADVT